MPNCLKKKTTPFSKLTESHQTKFVQLTFALAVKEFIDQVYRNKFLNK